MTARLPLIAPRSYLGAMETGRYPYTMAPRTLWRQTVRASALETAASAVTVLGTVGAIADGDFVLDFHDRNDVQVAQVTVPVGGGDPADVAGLAQDIAEAITLESDLDAYRADDATFDGADFAVEFVAGANLTVTVNAEPVASITLAHVATVNLHTLAPLNEFPRNMLREAEPYVRVTEAWPAGTVVSLDADGVASSTVIDSAALDVTGAIHGTPTTLSVTDMVEPAWEPIVIIELGEDAAPDAGAFEVVVPFSPILAPERL